MKAHNDIMLSLNSGDNVVLVLLNYTSAFDTVNHNLLLSRLKSVLELQVLFCFVHVISL